MLVCSAGAEAPASRCYARVEIHQRQCACESLCKCWPRTGLLCNLCGPGLLFSVRTKPLCRFRCVHAPLAQRGPRRGATLRVEIHWLGDACQAKPEYMPTPAFPRLVFLPSRESRAPPGGASCFCGACFCVACFCGVKRSVNQREAYWRELLSRERREMLPQARRGV